MEKVVLSLYSLEKLASMLQQHGKHREIQITLV